MSKKIPPYSRPLYLLQQKNLRPYNSVYVYIGNDAWKRGQNFSCSNPTRTIVIPPFLDPDIYDFPVKNCDVLVVDTSYAEIEYIESVAISLFKNSAKIVRVVSPDKTLTVYKKDF